jgi:hypothetical protein
MIQAIARFRSLFVCAILGLAISACGGGASTGLTKAGTPPPIVTLTPTPLQLCQISVPGSTAPTDANNNYPGVEFIPYRPQSTMKLVSTVGVPSDLMGQFKVFTFTVCSPATAAADIMPFYTAQMPAKGWETAPDFPTDGQLHEPCAGQCWSTGGKAIKASVASPTTGSIPSTATFQLMTTLPPPLPTIECLANEYNSAKLAEFTTSFAPDIPLPPLAAQTLGEGAPGITQARYCSAGSPSSVNAFFSAVLPVKGWALGSLLAATVPACSSGRAPVNGWIKGGNRLLKFTIPNGPSYSPGSGFKWSLTYCASP